MARTKVTVLDDVTPLSGERIDVGVRIGWLLRMARTTAPEPLALEEMARRTGTNVTRLHRAETGQLRSGRILDAYAGALGLDEGALRAPVDVICRGFTYSPPDRDPGPPVTSVREMSALTDQVGAPGVTGGRWLAWARALAQPGAIGLPEALTAELVRTLVGELQRATAHGYVTRYEALAALRTSGYGHVVLEVAQEVAADPHVQVLYDLMSGVGEAATPDAVAWCLELLDQDRPRLVIGGALALENMAEISGRTDFWDDLVPRLLDCFDAHPAGGVHDEWLSHLLRLVPRPALTRAGRRPSRALASTADIPDWSRTRLNRHWSECQSRALAVTTALGIPEQPLLARLLFDLAMSPHETRAVTAYMLLGDLPAFRVPVAGHVAELAVEHPDPVVRDRAGRRLNGVLRGERSEVTDAWLTSSVGAERDRALMAAGAAGVQVPVPVLRAAIAEGSAGPALYAAGMAGHPALRRLARDSALAPETRGAARWWLRAGSRVTS